MKATIRNAVPLCLALAGLAFSSASAALAQASAAQSHAPHKYIWLENTSIKPGMMHAYALEEAKGVQADQAIHSQVSYTQWQNITGPPTVLSVAGFNSFAEMAKQHGIRYANPQYVASMRSIAEAEAPMETASMSSVYMLRSDQSSIDTSTKHHPFVEITRYEIRPGQMANWDRLVALYKKAFETAVPESHWYVYDKMYGVGSANTVLIVAPLSSLGTVDAMMGDDAKLAKAVGKEQLQMLQAMEDKAVESSQSDLFVINPSMSYDAASKK